MVREIQSIAINKKGDGETNFKIPGGLVASDMKVIAFIQDRDDLKIIGATDTTIQ